MIRATGYKVIVKADPVEETTESGIQIVRENPDLEKSKQDTGVLVHIGSQAWQDFGDGSPWAEVGDRVVFARYGGNKVVDPETEEEYIVLNDKDINAVIEG